MKKMISQCKLILIVIMLSSMVMPTIGAEGKSVETSSSSITYAVNSSGDESDNNLADNVCKAASGVCTLRAAIEQANAHAGPDTITIPSMTIFVNKELETHLCYLQDTSVNIIGAGQSQTIIDGQQKTRVFYFEARSGTHSISNLTIQNGYNLANPTAARWVKNGGGIFSEAKLSLTNVTIINGHAYSGGGVYGEYAFPNPQGDWNIPSLDLKNVTVQNSKAISTDGWNTGGGIFSGSLLTADGIYLYNNTAYVGAGLYQNSPRGMENHISTVKNFIIRGNIAVDGAGIGNDLGDFILSNGLIEQNQTSGCRVNDPSCEYGAGAGIYNNEGSMNITGVTFQGNTVTQKRGYAGGMFSREQASLTSVSFVNNSASVGGALFNGNYDNVANCMSINGSSFLNNLGIDSLSPPIDSLGGAIYNIGTLIIKNTKFDVNKASFGGAIFNYLYMSLTNVSITNGQAKIGSGIFNGNYASAPNGLTLINTTISKNIGTSGAPESGGGGVYNYTNGYVIIINSTISNNQASRGGGIVNDGSVDMVNTLMVGNVGWVESQDCRGQIYSSGNNLVQSTAGCSYQPGPSDIIGINPQLGQLVTSRAVYFQPLLSGSPAIDKANISKCPTFDTIGNPRPIGMGCDIGALEASNALFSHFIYLPTIQ
jgi:large repetitive protein